LIGYDHCVRAVWLTLLAGCYAPHPQTGAACPTGVCPEPLVCSPASQTCEVTAVDAPPLLRDAPMIDARVDAPRDAPVDASTPPGARLVEQAVGHVDGDTLVISLPALPTTGDVLVFIGAAVHAQLDANAGVTGGGVTTWTRAAFSDINSNAEIWYGVTDGASKDIVIHGVVGDTHPMFGNVSEWGGLVTPPTLDGTTANDGLVSPADPGSITTTFAHDIVFMGVGDFVPNTFGTPTPGTWVALMGVNADIALGAWYHLVGPTTVHSTVTETAHQWDAVVAAFKVAP
jgi:hypothetical protein